MITIKEFQTAKKFLNESEGFMTENESENNLIIGLSYAIANGKKSISDPLFLSVIQDGRIIGAAIRTDEERPLSITRMPAEAIKIVVKEIIFRKIILAGVVGESVTSQKFAKIYSKLSSCDYELSMHQGIYETNNINLADKKSYKLIQAADTNYSTAIKFVQSFIQECFPNDKDSKITAEEIATRHVKNKTLYFLCNLDNEFIAMAANRRETKNTACISLVYTPPEHRKNGYGSIVAALVSRKMLDSGKKYCNLFTDLLNPTSNSIYKKIGYKMIGKSMHYNFIYRY